jgi:hypothetical protein
MFPMADDLSRGTTVRDRAALAGVARRHVIQNVLHRLAMG